MPGRILRKAMKMTGFEPPFLKFRLAYFDARRKMLDEPDFPLEPHSRKDKYPLRMMRYWQAHCALKAYQKEVQRPITVLDLGCERGLTKILSCDEVKGRWIGLDWNTNRPSLERANYDEVHQANFDQPLPLEDASVDAIVCLHVFEHLPRPEFTMSEVQRVLKPGGILLLGLPVLPKLLAQRREKGYRQELERGKRLKGHHINRFWPGRVRALCEKAGLGIDWLTGAHIFRWSGKGLENTRSWVRLNQMIGYAFPAAGRELYLQARKPLDGKAPSKRRRSGGGPAKALCLTAAVVAAS